jgi:RimJ/RimL family protein N-acetyltransferase
MWRPEDVEPLSEIYEEPDYLKAMPPTNADEQIAIWTRRWDDDGFSQWAACDRDTGRLIGRIGLVRHHDWPLVSEPIEVGWVLDRAYWGRGLATEGGRAAVDAWRTYLSDEMLYSFTVPENTRSRAVMERLGLTFGGTADWHGREHVWYSLDRDSA